MERLVIAHDQPLEGDLDEEQNIEALPEWYSVKGMFLTPFAEALGSDGWAEVEPKLVMPPKRGKYIAFKDYPQRDHFRLAAALARRQHPGASLREAMRRVSRSDFEIFGKSVIGRVMMTIAGSAQSTLGALPEAYRRVVKGQKIVTTPLTETRVRVDVHDDPAGWEYNLGQVEGIVLHFEPRCTTTVEVVSDSRYTMELDFG